MQVLRSRLASCSPLVAPAFSWKEAQPAIHWIYWLPGPDSNQRQRLTAATTFVSCCLIPLHPIAKLPEQHC